MVALTPPVDVKCEKIEDGLYRGTVVDETDERDAVELSLEEYERTKFVELLEATQTPGPVTESPWRYVGYVYVERDRLPVEYANPGPQFRVVVEDRLAVEIEEA
ncbi:MULTISPECIES: hypothetical protein [Halorussus]|uniref:hypothetical protein n=1 Tax=Halorussus TaxID=1070314 RepID=UPI00209E6363|nr:hypothetical protein [Halorussus vallis]USZ77537.1 hypothetical protein NGM07_09415 [Halorussus vallis]